MSKGITQQQYWVTGASSGIGKAIALKLAAEGHKVFISGRHYKTLRDIATQDAEHLIPLPCDVGRDDEMASVFDTLLEPPAYLDGIILSAGVCEYIDLPNLDIASIRRVAQVNYFGVVNCCSAALPLLRKAPGKPQIIGISSMSCYTGFPRAEAYGSSKAAMAYFLESLRCDIQDEVDVSIVYPGFVETPMTAQNDFAMPFTVTADYAAAYIVKKMQTRKRSIRFPWRLHLVLSLASFWPALWFGLVVPKLARKGEMHS